MNGAIHPMQTGSTFKTNKKTVKKKPNPLKEQKLVDYLDGKFLIKFTNDQGKILPRRITGVSAYQQRQIAKAIKYARHLALMPFVAQDLN
jgi:small subunit ribosomal protein S18